MSTCSLTEDIKTGDGSTKVFAFTFEYFKDREDQVKVAFYDDSTKSWKDQANPTVWDLQSPTKVEFVTAPANGQKIKIYRSTSSTLEAKFYPGSAIRAQDLNNNFEQLEYALQDSLCKGETNNGDINQIEVDLEKVEGDVTKLEARVSTNETDIATNKTDIATNKTNIATNTTNIATNKSDIATNKSDIATNKSNIATNTANIKTNTDDIADLKTKSGVSKITAGTNVTINPTTGKGDVTINATATPYTLPPATASTLGGIKVGTNLSVTPDGTLSATGGGGGIPEAPTDSKLYGREDSAWKEVTAAELGALTDAPNNANIYGRKGGAWDAISADDVGALKSGDNVSELVNDQGYIRSLTAGTGITVSSNTISVDRGTGINLSGNKLVLGDLEQLDNVTVTGVASGQVLKWNETNSRWENGANVSLPGTLTFIGRIDAVSDYVPSSEIVTGHFWVTEKPDDGEAAETANSGWTTVVIAGSSKTAGPVLQVRYGDMLAVAAEHTLDDGTKMRNHVVFGNVADTGKTGIQPGDNISLLNNDSGYITSSDIPAQVQSDFAESDSSKPAFIKNKPSVPAAPNDGQINVAAGNGLTASGNNATANQSANTTRTLTAKAGDNTILVDSDGIKVQKANLNIPAAQVNSDWNSTSGVSEILNKPSIPAAAGNGTITIAQAGLSNQTFTVNQSGNTTITLNDTVPSVGNGQINVNAGNGLTASGDNATANQSGNTTRTLSVQAANNTINVAAGGISVNTGNLGIPTVNDGVLTIAAGDGITASGSTFSANQADNVTRTISADTTWFDNRYATQAGAGSLVYLGTVTGDGVTAWEYTFPGGFEDYVVIGEEFRWQDQTAINGWIQASQTYQNDRSIIDFKAHCSTTQSDIRYMSFKTGQQTSADFYYNPSSNNYNYSTQTLSEGMCYFRSGQLEDKGYKQLEGDSVWIHEILPQGRYDFMMRFYQPLVSRFQHRVDVSSCYSDVNRMNPILGYYWSYGHDRFDQSIIVQGNTLTTAQQGVGDLVKTTITKFELFSDTYLANKMSSGQSNWPLSGKLKIYGVKPA